MAKEKIVEPIAKPIEQSVPPVQMAPPPPLTFERQGAKPGPMVRHFPQVIGGVCEYHGIIDNTKPSTEQYKLCPNDGVHPPYSYIRCSYCDENKDPDDVIYKSTMNIYSHPDKLNVLMAVCDNYTCLEKHRKRFEA